MQRLVRLLLPSLVLNQQQQQQEGQEQQQQEYTPSASATSASSSSELFTAGANEDGSEVATILTTVQASPGLITFLDHALYRSYEGQLTATTCAANHLLYTFLQLKQQSAQLLQIVSKQGCITFAQLASISTEDNNNNNNNNNTFTTASTNAIQIQATARFLSSIERLAKACVDYANHMMERITTDPLSLTTHWIPMIYEPHSSSSVESSSFSQNTPTTTNKTSRGDSSFEDVSSDNIPILHEDGNRIVSSSYSLDFNPSVWAIPSTTYNNNNNNTYTTIPSSYHHHSNKAHSRNQHHHGRTTRGGGGVDTTQEYPTPYYRSYSRMDCWESSRLYCPDYIWADDMYNHGCKILRSILRLDFIQLVLQYNHHHYSGEDGGGSGGGTAVTKQALLYIWNQMMGGESSSTTTDMFQWCFPLLSHVLTLIIQDIPQQLTPFKCAMEVNATILKRMYLIKNEYRAPFRAFLESHVHLQRMPNLAVVDSYLQFLDPTTKTSTSSCGLVIAQPQQQEDHPLWIQKKRDAEKKIQEAIQNPILVEALEIEKTCEELEMEMTQMLMPFGDLARFLQSKGGRIRAVENVVTVHVVPYLEELMRRLALLLPPKRMNPSSSNGIRQILLDLQGVERDASLSQFEVELFGKFENLSPREAACERIKVFLYELSTICSIAKIKGGFFFLDKKETDVPVPILQACTSSLDVEMFQAQFEDWYDLTQRQGELISSQEENEVEDFQQSLVFQKLSEDIRQAEMELSIALAPVQALSTVRQKLEQVENDRTKRFHVLREIVGDVCALEMDLKLDLKCPDMQSLLRLPEMPSAIGVFGILLQSHGEVLPL